MMFKYEVGQEFEYIPDSPFSKDGGKVTVVELKKRGAAKLSNGWVVDEDGVAEGTRRIPGGRIAKVQEASREINDEPFLVPKQAALERLMIEKGAV